LLDDKIIQGDRNSNRKGLCCYFKNGSKKWVALYFSVVIEGALKVAIESIKMENKEHDPIHKIVLVYHSDVTAYVIFRVEYSSGEVNHFA
jgi:hypothetical protein